MRSRYCAYALGEVEYIVGTTHPAGPHFDPDPLRWRAGIAQFCQGSEFIGLQILETGALPGDDAFVLFRAQLLQQGRDASFTERSRFRPLNGVWKYLDGQSRRRASPD